ncbi:allergin-1 isoform X4 [Heterocephalus glaber]|uniref:Allergin-1 isoform X4 n=1 Tax=Heterocephalus glaber TaxID=10181 RepID=A0AAX6S535_HETGA|nr:allergin-1 isoform X4 [Heterocephalus glaber]
MSHLYMCKSSKNMEKSKISLVPSISVQKAVLDCETMKKTHNFPPPSLNSSTHAITVRQNVSLFCSHKNKSMQITYSLFLSKKHLETKKGKGEPVIFYLTISKANDSGPYKCKAEVFNCSKYSPGFYFMVDGKAMRENVPKDPGDTPMEGELYENVCKDQAGAGDSQEIHYATPVFQEAARREQETCHDCKTGHVYSELTL